MKISPLLIVIVLLCISGFIPEAQAAPSNDSFSSPVVITGFPATAAGTNIAATLEPGEPLPAQYALEAGASVWFDWTATGSGPVRIDTIGSDFDTVLTVWTGSGLSNLTEIAANDQFGGDQSAVFLDVTAGTSYKIAVYGWDYGQNFDQGAISLRLMTDTSSRINGLVTGPDGTTPVAGAYAYAYVWDEDDDYWDFASNTTASANGSYSLRGLSPGRYRILYEDNSGTYLEEYFNNAQTFQTATDIIVGESSIIGGINVSLAIAGRVTGKVIGSDGITPIAGVEVRAYYWDEDFEDWDWQRSATSSADGTYTLGGLSTGIYRLRFIDPSGDRLSEYYDNSLTVAGAADIAVAAGSTTAGINASLADAGRISGTVVGPNGITPLIGSGVFAYFEDEDGYWDWERTASTAANGTYEIKGLVAGNYRLHFIDPAGNFLSEYYNNSTTLGSGANIPIATSQSVTGINASLALAGHISGTVTGPNGVTPLPDIWVEIYVSDSSGNEHDYLTGVYTGTDGSYQVGGLPGGSYRVGFFDDGYWIHTSEFYNNSPTLAGSTQVMVTQGQTTSGINASLAERSQIRGTVKALGTNVPLGDIQVRAYYWEGDYWNWYDSTYTESDGIFSLPVDPGTYRIRFYDGNGEYLTEYYDNAVGIDGATDVAVGPNAVVTGIDASLAVASQITGKVTGPDGITPLEYIDVDVYKWDEVLGEWDYFSWGYTDGNGTYKIGSLPAGIYRVEFYDYEYELYAGEYFANSRTFGLATDIVVAAGSIAGGIDASLDLLGGITGLVTGPDGTTPLPDVEVKAYYWDAFDEVWYSARTRYTDSEGTFHLEGLVEDTYRLRFLDYSGTYLAEHYNNAATLSTATDVVVDEFQTVSGINASLSSNPPEAPQASGFRKTAAGLYEMDFSGAIGSYYQLQKSMTLDQWLDVGERFSCQPGINVLPLDSTESKMFWRVRLAP